MPQQAGVYIDRDETLSCVEKGGVVRSLTRRCRVTGLTNLDYTALSTALTAIGIPTVPSALPQFPALLLDERHVKLVDGDSGTVDIDLVYNHILDSDIQELANFTVGGAGVVYGKVKCSIQQKQTNLYTDPSNPNSTQQQITVQYTYPATDLKHPNQTVVQGGVVTVAVPQTTLQFSGYISTSAPQVMANILIASVNLKYWQNQAMFTWMCTEVGYRWVGPGRYKFDFEFQNNPDGWEPTAVFIDPDTNTAPPGLVKGVGYKQILYHLQADYDAIFNSYFDGASQIS